MVLDRLRLCLLTLLALAVLPFATRATATPPSFAENYGTDNYDGDGHLYEDPYYGSGFDYPTAIAKMPDGGFVVAGQIDFPELYRTVTAHTSDRATGVLVRFAADGTILWQHAIRQTNDRVDGNGAFFPGTSKISQLAADGQGNIFVTGGKANTVNGSLVPFAAKFSPDGDLLWQKGINKVVVVDGNPPQSSDVSVGVSGGPISVTHDGGVVFSVIQNGPTRGKPALVKFNADGSIAFYKAIEPGFASGSWPVCQSLDGTRFVMAVSNSNNFNHVLLVTDASGNLIAQRAYSPWDYSNETPVAIIATADGGFASLSQVGSAGILRKFNSDMSAALFEKHIKVAPGYSGFLSLNTLTQAANGGFIIGGTAQEQGYPSRGYKVLVMKLDGAGGLQSASIYGGDKADGGPAILPNGPSTSVAIETNDGGYAFAATSLSFTTGTTCQYCSLKPDWWIAKTNPSRTLRNFNGVMADQPLETYAITSSTASAVNISDFMPPSYAYGPDTTLEPQTNPNFVIHDIAAKSPPNQPTIVIQANSPRILSPVKAEAYVGRHFSYHIVAGFFGANATLSFGATNLPQNFTINPATGVIAGVPANGSQTTTPILIGLSVTDGTDTVKAMLALTIGDGAPALLVNDMDQPLPNMADRVLTFVAKQTGVPPGRVLTVEATTTPDVPSSWQPLPTDTNGFMKYEAVRADYVLGTTIYPHVNGVYFRAHATTPDRPDQFSNVVGPFDLTSNAQRLGKTNLFITHNGPVANIRFGVTEETLPAGVSVRMQATKTPTSEGSWLDVPNGQLVQDTNTPAPHQFYLGLDDYPDSSGVYFRAVASASGHVQSVSGAHGPYTFITDPAADVALTIPGVSGSSGQDFDFPITPSSSSFNVSANATSGRQIVGLDLVYDGDTLEHFTSQSGTTLYTTSVAGDHIIEAVAKDNLGVMGDARPVHVRVAPALPGRIFYLTAAGNWTDPAIWIDGNGNHAVPGVNDFAVLGGVDVTLTSNITVRAVSMNGAKIGYTGSTKPKLTITGFFTVGGGRIDTDVDVADGATMLLLNDQNLACAGLITNSGRLKFHGKGGVVGVTQNAPGQFATADDPDGLFAFLGSLWNKATAIFQRPAGGRRGNTTPPAPAPNPTPVPEVRQIQLASLANSGKIVATGAGNIVATGGGNATGNISLPAAGIVATGGGNAASKTPSGLVNANGSPIVASGAGNIVAAGAGNLIGNDGAGLIGNDGAGLIGNDGAGIVATGGGNVIGNDGASLKVGSASAGSAARANGVVLPDGFTQTSGEMNMTGFTIVGPVQLDGGILQGSGSIVGDLTNNSGVVAPGTSSGLLGVTGSFSQGPGGTLIIRATGGEFNQFDQVHAGGDASLGGNLKIYTFNNYTPLVDDPFAPLAFNGATGGFASVSSNAQVTVTSDGAVSALPASPAPPPALAVSAVKSRKTHSNGSTFDVNMNLDGSGVEPRSGGATNDYTVVFTLTNPLTSVAGASVVSGTGSLVSTGIGANPNEFVVNLTGVTNAQAVSLGVNGLTDTFNQMNNSVSGSLRVLVGDVNGDGNVNSGDATVVRNRSGQPTDALNFRADVNADGTVNSGDLIIVRSRSGTSLGASAALPETRTSFSP